MQGPTTRSVSLTLAAFIVAAFGVQATSHFLINAEHYAGISIMRAEPIMALGFAAMVVQGILAGLLYPELRWADGSIRSGVKFGLMIGTFLAAYIVLAEPAKYLVPSIGEWMLVEAGAFLVQFSIFGALVGVVHRGETATLAE